MLYVSGLHALSVLDVINVARYPSIDWDTLDIRNSSDSVFGNYGIDSHKVEIENKGKFHIANKVRVLLDYIESRVDLSNLIDAKKDLGLTEDNILELFDKVFLLRFKYNWFSIEDYMKKEFMWEWNKYMSSYSVDFIKLFLSYINSKSNKFVLKGTSALSLYYNLNQFSNIIYLDGYDINFMGLLLDFCKCNNIVYRLVECTDKVYVVQLQYAIGHDIMVSVSRKCKNMNKSEVVKIDGVLVYKVNAIMSDKLDSLRETFNIRDLFDVVFIYNNYKNCIGSEVLTKLTNILSESAYSKGYYIYLISQQRDELIDNAALTECFIGMYHDLGLR